MSAVLIFYIFPELRASVYPPSQLLTSQRQTHLPKLRFMQKQRRFQKALDAIFLSLLDILDAHFRNSIQLIYNFNHHQPLLQQSQ